MIIIRIHLINRINQKIIEDITTATFIQHVAFLLLIYKELAVTVIDLT